MQTIRRTVVAAALLALMLTTAAVASPRQQDGPRAQQPRQVQKQEKPQQPRKGLITTILDYVQNGFSIPPG
ncbi:MAG: hypothetical protein ACRD3J_28385 [Thermoanaerobaculia bacterium]